MGDIKIGTKSLTKMFVGTKEVDRALLGDVVIFTSLPYLQDAFSASVVDSNSKYVLVNGVEPYKSAYTGAEMDLFMTSVLGS